MGIQEVQKNMCEIIINQKDTEGILHTCIIKLPSQNLEDFLKSAALITGYFFPLVSLMLELEDQVILNPPGFQCLSWFTALMLHWTGRRASACNYSANSVNRQNKNLLAESKIHPTKILRGSWCVLHKSTLCSRVNQGALPVSEPKPVHHLFEAVKNKTKQNKHHVESIR